MTREPEIVVTNHAILRWLERVDGVDIEALRRRLAAAARIGARHGASGVIVGRGRLVLRARVVKTVLLRGHVRVDMIDAPAIELDPSEIGTPGKRRRR